MNLGHSSGNPSSEAALQRGLWRLHGEEHSGESKTRLFSLFSTLNNLDHSDPPERLSQSQTLWAEDPPSSKAPHSQRWATPPDYCTRLRPRAQTSPGIINSKFQVPPLSPRPSSSSALPSEPRPPAEAQFHTWSRGAEVRRAPQKPLKPVRRWGGLGVWVAAEALAGPESSGD